MQPEHFKWVTLENESGTDSLKQHGFIPKICHKIYTGEEYIGNVSLCGNVYADDGSGNEEVGEWRKLKDEGREQNSCKVCQRKADKFSTKPPYEK